MKYKIKNLCKFECNVFGADSFIANFPELQSTGVELKNYDGFYYIMIDDKQAHESCFFSEEEMEHLEEVPA